MKIFYILFFSVLFLGCQSLERNAYRTIGTVAVGVDSAMNAWGDYVRAGMATPQQEQIVKLAYTKYQTSMEACKVAVYIYKTSQASEKDFPQSALDALSKNASDLVNIILKLLPDDAKKGVVQ